jgi:hypothetical protein
MLGASVLLDHTNQYLGVLLFGRWAIPVTRVLTVIALIGLASWVTCFAVFCSDRLHDPPVTSPSRKNTIRVLVVAVLSIGWLLPAPLVIPMALMDFGDTWRVLEPPGPGGCRIIAVSQHGSMADPTRETTLFQITEPGSIVIRSGQGGFSNQIAEGNPLGTNQWSLNWDGFIGTVTVVLPHGTSKARSMDCSPAATSR